MHLVPQLCRRDKIEILGSSEHGLSGLLDRLGKLVCVHVLNDRVGGNGDAFGFGISKRFLAGKYGRSLNGLVERLRSDIVFGIVPQLFLPSAVRLIDGQAHGLRNGIGIHDDGTFDVTCRSAGCLGQRAMRPKEPLLVGIENGDERNFRKIESFAQEINANEDVDHTFPERIEYLYPFHRIDIAMDIIHPYAVVEQIGSEFLRHTFGESSNERSLILLPSLFDLLHEVIDLVEGRPNIDNGVEQTRRSDNLFDELATGFLQFIVGRCCGNIDGLRLQFGKLLELQWSVVGSGGESEPVFNEIRLARLVASVHGLNLRYGYMGLVNDQQEILREIVEQAERARPRRSSVEIARVVLNTLTITEFENHLDIVVDAFGQALGFERSSFAFKLIDTKTEVVPDVVDSHPYTLLAGYEDRSGVDVEFVERVYFAAGNRFDGQEFVDLVAPKDDAQCEILVSEKDVHRITLDAEITSVEFYLVTDILSVDEIKEKGVADVVCAFLQRNKIGIERIGVSHAVDTGHRADDHHVPSSGKQRRNGGESEFVNLVVDGEVLLDIGIGGGDIGFWLVIVVVGDKILDLVVRKEPLNSL